MDEMVSLCKDLEWHEMLRSLEEALVIGKTKSAGKALNWRQPKVTAVAHRRLHPIDATASCSARVCQKQLDKMHCWAGCAGVCARGQVHEGSPSAPAARVCQHGRSS